MEYLSKISWFVSFLALLGVVLNIHKSKYCFHIWSGTNLFFCIYDYTIGATAQAALFAIYFVLALWGIWEWRIK